MYLKGFVVSGLVPSLVVFQVPVMGFTIQICLPSPNYGLHYPESWFIHNKWLRVSDIWLVWLYMILQIIHAC